MNSLRESYVGRSFPRLLFVATALLSFTLVWADAAEFIKVRLVRTKASASSTLIEPGKPANFYAAMNIHDGEVTTAWCAGTGRAVGETLELRFQPTPAGAISILNGYGRTMALYMANNRVKDLELTVFERSGRTEVIRGKFGPGLEHCDQGRESVRGQCEEKSEGRGSKAVAACVEKQMRTQSCTASGPGEPTGQAFHLKKPACIVGLRIKILAVHPGAKYRDTCIAEVGVNNAWYPGGSGEDSILPETKALCR